MRMIFDLDGRPFHFKKRRGNNNGPLVPADGPLVVMNGPAAGWRGWFPPAVGGGTDWHHGREGAGVSIVLDLMPTLLVGWAGAAEGLGHLTHRRVAKFFANEMMAP